MGGDIKKCMTVLNNAFLTRTFLVGERVTLADIAVCSNLVMLYQQVMEPSFRAPFGNVNRWFMTVINQPQCKEVLGSPSQERWQEKGQQRKRTAPERPETQAG